MKYIIRAESPVVEQEVTREDTKETIIVGFRRYFKEDFVFAESNKDIDPEELLRKDVLYIKNGIIRDYDPDTWELKREIIVEDTRKVQPVEEVWSNSKECLVVLLNMYLGHLLWTDSFYKAYNKSFGSFVNSTELQIKN